MRIEDQLSNAECKYMDIDCLHFNNCRCLHPASSNNFCPFDEIKEKDENTIEEAEMNIVYGINRWTNASRGSTAHIDNSKGYPLCKDKRKVSSWVRDIGKPTCRKCIRQFKQQAEDAGRAE